MLGYFGLAIVVDTVFAGAAFCKHLCPIGQFNLAASTLSPTELRIVDRETCRSCRTSDCIKGNEAYDQRPPPYMLVWYLVPFLLAGFLWTQLPLSRRKLLALSKVEGLRKP